MSKTPKWNDLRDGSRLHAVHLFEMADAAREATAAAIAGAGAGGRFINPGLGKAPVNHIQLDHDNRIVDIDNLLLLTPGGFLAELPPPRKSFAVPPDGEHRFLNLYARDYASAGGKTEAKWEKQGPSEPRGVCLAEWHVTEAKLRLAPQPFTLDAMTNSSRAFAELVEANSALVALLISGDPRVSAQLRLSPQTLHFAEPLLAALEAVNNLATNTALDVALPHLGALAIELESWFCFGAQATQGGANRAQQPDPLSRRAAAARGSLGLPDYVQALKTRPADGSELLLLLDALTRATVGLTRAILGERDEDPLEPIEVFEPDPWPDGSGFKYRLPAGVEISLRCEVLFDVEPQLLCGVGPSGLLPQLRALPLERLEHGRFETSAGPFNLGPNDELVLVLDDAAAALRVFQKR